MTLQADVLIVTATKVESRAVIDAFSKLTDQPACPVPVNDRIYQDLGEVRGTRVFLGLTEMGSGSLGASQQAVQKGIEALQPRAVVLVGIAFGVDEKKQHIGDILVSQQLQLYDLQRVGQEIIPRGDKPHASTRLIDYFRHADLSWDDSNAKVRFGLVLSGEKLVDQLDYREQLKQWGREAIGGEMEGAGLYVACQDAKVDWIVVKAICDWADGHKAEDQEARQRWAARNAAAFVACALQTVPFVPSVGPSEAGVIAGGSAFRRYYQNCIERWSKPRYALDQRFVHLTLLIDQGDEAQGPRWAPQAQRFATLDEVLAKVPDPALVLLGPPGSGKSTLLRHFELDHAHAALAAADSTDAPVTFFIALNSYGTRGEDAPSRPLDWLVERWEAQKLELPPLNALLRERRVTLLLDALNEMPQAGPEPLRRWKAFLAELTQHYPGNRVIFSCRSLDYSATLSSKDLPVPQVRIEALSDAQIQEFLALYCPTHHVALWGNLANSPQLEVLRSPYFLKLLVAQTTTGEISEGRAALFGGFVRHALQREIEADHLLFQSGTLLGERDRTRFQEPRSWKTPHELPRQGLLFDELSHLAFQMQAQRQPGEASQVRIGYSDALDLLAHDQGDDVLKAGEALGVLEEDLGRDEVLYVHQLLQEYFAACWLSAHPEPHWVQVEWRADRVSEHLQDTLAGLADSDPLPPLPGTGWEETAVLAAAMAANPDAFITDLMPTSLALAGRCAAQPDVRVSENVKDFLRHALIQRTQDPTADLRARIAAGLALGELGDPRLQRGQGPHGEYLLPPLIAILGGVYSIGSDEGLYDDEAPVHAVELQPFQLGLFPVTNAEYARFIKAGGYEDERWWDTAAAKAWWRGESTVEGAQQQWRENR